MIGAKCDLIVYSWRVSIYLPHTLAYVLIAIHDGVLLNWKRSGEFLEGPEFVWNFRHIMFHGIQEKLDPIDYHNDEIQKIK